MVFLCSMSGKACACTDVWLAQSLFSGHLCVSPTDSCLPEKCVFRCIMTLWIVNFADFFLMSVIQIVAASWL